MCVCVYVCGCTLEYIGRISIDSEVASGAPKMLEITH